MSSHSHRKDEPEEQSNPPEGENLGGLLGALLGGMTEGQAPQPNPPAAPHNAPQGGDEVLGNLGSLDNAPMMGQGSPPMSGQGGAPQSGGMPAGTSGDPMSDLFGSLLGGAGGGAAAGGQGGDLGSLLGGLLGGAGAQGNMPSSGSGDPMSDLLGSLLGGGGNAPAMGGQGDAMGGLLGGLLGGMGGGQPQTGAMGGAGGLSSILAPLADKLAEKTGIPPQIAMTAMAIIIPMVVNKLMSSGQAGGDPTSALGSMKKHGLTFTPHEQNEMVSQLTSQTGMDHQAATQTIHQAVQVLSSN